MSPPRPRINTFVETSQPTIEPISKIFILSGLIMGANRLPLLATTKNFWIVLMLCYPTFLNILFFFTTLQLVSYVDMNSMAWSCSLITDNLQYLLCTFLSFILHKRLLKFYVNLNEFDTDIGINLTKFGIQESAYNFLQQLVTIAGSLSLYFLNVSSFIYYLHFPHQIPMKLIICLEVHYYGHLISLLVPRLKAINNFMKHSYTNDKSTIVGTQSDQEVQEEAKRSQVDMKRLMDFYNKIIGVYESLNEAVKWQMLTYLITTFAISLNMLLYIVKFLISEKTKQNEVMLVCISELTLQLFPLLVPCVFADRVQKEVHLIKDLIVCKIYKNTLDKPSRRTARTLLALIETRNLSFSLFDMFSIDISFPFKFIALLITYLIILLQFDKVIFV